MAFDYVLYDLSYINLILYSSVLPSYDTEETKENAPLFDASKDASIPDNFNETEEIVIVKG